MHGDMERSTHLLGVLEVLIELTFDMHEVDFRTLWSLHEKLFEGGVLPHFLGVQSEDRFVALATNSRFAFDH